MPDRQLPMTCGTDPCRALWTESNGFAFALDLAPGLYTATLHVDLRRFDWVRLWYPLTLFGNQGQRTGPWDFDLYDNNVPLLPAWRVERDGHPLGLLHVERPGIDVLESRRAIAQFGFRMACGGPVRFRCTPLKAFDLDPIALCVEPSAFDVLEEQRWASRGLAANWAWSLNTQWDALAARLRGGEWEACLRGALAVFDRDREAAGGTPTAAACRADAAGVYAFAFRCFGDPAHLATVQAFVRQQLDLPAWGNPDPDGYGHNGDMTCGHTLKQLALVYNWLGGHLGAVQDELLARLRQQARVFLDQQLLTSQYWGGAILQDHGFRSTACFGIAALSLLGHAPEAADYLAFIVPRIRRTVRGLPEDGFIPFTSYHKVSLYAHEMTELRVALLHASGEDLFAAPAYRNVPDFLLATFDAASMSQHLCVTRGDRKDLNVGLPFLLALAADPGNAKAGYLAHCLIKHYRDHGFGRRDAASGEAFPRKACESMPFACLLAASAALQAEPPAVPALHHFPDGGFLTYVNRERRFHVAVGCYPHSQAFHAMGTDLSGTDQALGNPSQGMFTVAVGREPLIQTAESGYRTGTDLANVLLIDGQGQRGDIRSPMMVPLKQWHGARIQTCRYDARDRTGTARLNLAPAYPESLGVLSYTRDFTFAPTRLQVRDTVICQEPRCFQYRFHTYQRHRLVARGDNIFLIGHGADAVELAFQGADLQTRTAPTETVWAYGNEQEDQPFVHIEVTTTRRACALVVDFVVTLL